MLNAIKCKRVWSMRLKDEKTTINKMFGFIFEQPLHITLRQMRIVHIFALYSADRLVWDLVGLLKGLDKTAAATATGAIAAALIAAIWRGLDGLNNPVNKD